MTNTITSTSIAPTPIIDTNSITLIPRNSVASVDGLEPHDVLPSSLFYYYGAVRIYLIKLFINRNDI